MEEIQKRIAAEAIGGILSSPGKQNGNSGLNQLGSQFPTRELEVTSMSPISRRKLLKLGTLGGIGALGVPGWLERGLPLRCEGLGNLRSIRGCFGHGITVPNGA